VPTPDAHAYLRDKAHRQAMEKAMAQMGPDEAGAAGLQTAKSLPSSMQRVPSRNTGGAEAGETSAPTSSVRGATRFAQVGVTSV
jgi:hypothetical protein